MSEKIFCGSGRIITTKYGGLTKMSFSEKDIEILKNNLKNGWVNVVVKEKQNKVEGKPTHYVEVDTYEPNKAVSTSAPTTETPTTDSIYAPKTEADGLPF